MSWSLGEIRYLSIKATRGVGYAWGFCEEAGYCVYWLQTTGLPGAAALAQFLNHLTTTGSHPHDLAETCPIQRGTLFSDLRQDPPPTISGLRQPLLMVPFIANSHRAVEGFFTFARLQCAVSRDGANINAAGRECLVDVADARWKSAKVRTIEAKRFSRVPDSEGDAISQLESLAMRTYAPATEASRLKGAGAGTSDND